MRAEFGPNFELRARVPGIPYLFRVVGSFPGDGKVLLHRDRIYRSKGLTALGSYLAEIEFLRRGKPPVNSVKALWLHVYSPPKRMDGIEEGPHATYATGRFHPALAPRLVWTRKQAALSLYYLLPLPPRPTSGPRSVWPAHEVVEWRLIIPSDYRLRHEKRRHWYHTRSKRFVKSRLPNVDNED